VRTATRSLKITAIALTAFSAALWGGAAADMWGDMPARVMPADRSGAVTVTIVAALCWLALGLRRQGDEVYARVIAELAERQACRERRHLRRAADSGPLPRA
jgi:hypothetical protein